MDYTVHGILQARILEWVAVPFSRESSQHRDETHSHLHYSVPPLESKCHPDTSSKTHSLKSETERHSVLSDSLRPHGLYSPWNSPGQNTGMGSLSLLQGIFPTQGSNPGLPYCRQILYQLSHQGSPRILEWVVYSFSSRSS